MTIIVFLVDTSSSMCQKCYVNGVQKTFLDIAKGAVETFLKYRQRSQDCMGDRYMLLSFEDPPNNIKAGWKENHATLMNELKNLQCNGLTSMGEALKNAFDLLNLNRTQTGIDTYGQGRCPFYVEPSVIIVITDGGRYTYRTGVYQETELLLPLNTQIPGSKFTKEPFRWDQRLFSLVLRIPGNKVEERLEGKVPHDNSPIEKMCEVTGGRSYRIKSQFVLNQCIESLVQKVQPGVVLQFEPQISNGEMAPIGGSANASGNDINFQPSKKMIYVQKFPSQPKYPVGYWPIPEPYWPDPKATTLPPRDAHPKIRITSTYIDEPQVIRNFPVDKYEVEASPLTQQILSKREINKCWHVIVPYGIHGFEAPFGYIKASPNFCQVHLYVLSYNFPVLLPLLNDLVNKHSMSPPNDWIYRFTSYTRSIPQYYCPFLRRALQNILVPYTLLSYILPESMDNYLNPGVANYLKQIKNTAKQDQENLCLRVYKQVRQPKPPYRPIEIAKLNCGQSLRRDLVRNPLLRETFSKLHSEITTYENYTIFVPTMNKQQSAKSYRNPFDIPRRELIEEISRMRENFLKLGKGPPGSSLTSKDVGHRLPIAEMGNYQEYLRNRQTPLRELEQTNVRQHMFGNPYKKDKHMVMIDEAELDNDPMIKQQQQNPMKKMEQSTRMRSKRKAGPIRKDFIFRRSSTDSRSSQDSLGSLVRCNNGIPLSPMSTNSDIEMSDTESCMSDTSSIMSDDSDADRLVFDFTEPSEDFPINGHVRNFINGGDFDDGDEPHHPTTAPPPLQSNGNGVLTPSLIVGPGMYNPIPEAPPSPSPSPQLSLFTNHLQNGIATPTPPLQPIIPQPSTATFHHMTSHNDINDAQEISRILQQCHNGTVVPETKPVENNVAPVVPEPMIEEESAVEEQKSDEEDEMTEEQMDKVKQNNTEARTTIFKDIRRPGRNYSILLDHLGLVKGDYETRFNFIQMCITEALRFRRKKMADCIEEWWAKHHNGNSQRQHVS